MLECVICGKHFKSKKEDKKTCSSACTKQLNAQEMIQPTGKFACWRCGEIKRFEDEGIKKKGTLWIYCNHCRDLPPQEKKKRNADKWRFNNKKIWKETQPLEDRLELYVNEEWTVDLTWEMIANDYPNLTKEKLEKMMQKIADKKGLWLYKMPKERRVEVVTIRGRKFETVENTMDYIWEYNRRLQKEQGFKPKKEVSITQLKSLVGCSLNTMQGEDRGRK